jgi:hypothetical protein
LTIAKIGRIMAPMEHSTLRECKRCGYLWTSRVKEPKVCPRCISYKWKTPRPAKPEEQELPDTGIPSDRKFQEEFRERNNKGGSE